MKSEIIDRYKDKLLGARNDEIKADYFVEDFLNQEEFIDFVVSTYDHETSFTKEGFEFIEKYYGLDTVIEMVLKEYPNYPFEEGLTPKDALLTKKEFAIDNEQRRHN